MAEVIRGLDTIVRDDSGTYVPRVVGRLAEDGMWEAWIEFASDGGGETLVGPVESRQSEREHLVYWAGGLTGVYMEGALKRARSPIVVRTRVVEAPASELPAPRITTTPERER